MTQSFSELQLSPKLARAIAEMGYESMTPIQAQAIPVVLQGRDVMGAAQTGTGKTAVALHRAAYLLFEHRGRLTRDGVLVVGPNKAFLDYIANVLPSLGERSVRQSTVDELCIPRVPVSVEDDVELGLLLGCLGGRASTATAGGGDGDRCGRGDLRRLVGGGARSGRQGALPCAH